MNHIYAPTITEPVVKLVAKAWWNKIATKTGNPILEMFVLYKLINDSTLVINKSTVAIPNNPVSKIIEM